MPSSTAAGNGSPVMSWSMTMSERTIPLSQLESHLWEAANILRGPVYAADFKTYVFPLLFFKRISDVHDEEYAAALAESGGDEEYAVLPQNYRFQVPEGCHWDNVRVVTTNVGQAHGALDSRIERLNEADEGSQPSSGHLPHKSNLRPGKDPRLDPGLHRHLRRRGAGARL